MPEYNFLVVEDSPTMRQLISFALKRIPGSKIVEANDGIDALKKLSTQKFDIILTDINMPIMDGLKARFHGAERPRRTRPFPSSSSPPKARRKTASAGLPWAQMPTSPSPSRRRNF